MALINCPECNKEISDKAKQCIHCGYPIASEQNSVGSVGNECCLEESRVKPAPVVNPIEIKKEAVNKKSAKKVVIGVFVFLLVCALCFFEPIFYYAAVKQYERGDYEDASLMFSNMGDYLDAVYYYEDCQKHIYADYAFLESIEQSLIKNFELNDRRVEEKTIIKTELMYLDGFYIKKFYDSKLQGYAREYIEALNTQKDALESKYIDSTIRYSTGAVERYSVLNKLYYEYNLLESNAEFISTYVDGMDAVELQLEAYKEIKNDIGKQIRELKAVNCTNTTASITLKNNTVYEYNIFVALDYFDKNKKLIYQDFGTAYDISPNKKITVKIPCPSSWETCRIYWDAGGVS